LRLADVAEQDLLREDSLREETRLASRKELPNRNPENYTYS
jgi:hypothetical protein